MDDFPRDELRALLQAAQHMFASAQDRRNLLASLGLSGAAAERQPTMAGVAAAPADAREREAAGFETERVPSPARFAAELVELVAQPSTLDVAVTLARRAVNELDAALAPRWHGLIGALEELQRRHRSQAAPDLDAYRGWIGFECKHPYSLTDRFFGREAYIAELDEWATAKDDVVVRSICALGGGGKSALAWQWVSSSLTALRQQGYHGAFWCSFYEKNFNFDEFLRRALAFAGRIEEAKLPVSRTEVEERLLDVLRRGRFLVVLDGLERLMNGYALVADRAVDLEGQAGVLSQGDVARSERRMADPRDGAFLRRLADAQGSRILITTRLAPADLEEAGRAAPVPHVAFTDLPGFTAKEAVALWKSLAPSAPVTDALHALFRACGYHPLVISIVARSVVHAGGTWEDWLALDAHADFDLRGQTSEAGVRSHVIGMCMRDLPEQTYDLLGVLTATGKPMHLDELAGVLLLGSAASGDGRWTSDAAVTAQLETLVRLGLVGAATPPQQSTEYDVHPVVRGAAWSLLIDPKRERFLEYALSELAATPDRRGPDELGALSKAIALYQLFVRTRQLDRAWEMFTTRLWYPLNRDSANRELYDLYRMLLPDRDVLQLLPLASRRAQADATGKLGQLLEHSGDGPHAERLLRWCGAISLQIGDHLGFLAAAHTRAWQTMYEGRLFETERELRQIRLEALAYGAFELRPALECWIGIVFALRGDRDAARACFEAARGKTESYRWWAQGLAEGLVYLEEADQALEVLGLLEGGAGSRGSDEPMQAAWEKLTQGMAYFHVGSHDKALDVLANARADARKANYAIIQCFAIPYIAEVLLSLKRMAEAEETAASYHEVDPHERYALCAADALRVRARCRFARGDHDAARADATRAYRLAACDGPPFVYHAGLRRAFQVLEECGSYVPETSATLDPRWRERLAELDAAERELGRDIAAQLSGVDQPVRAEPTFEEALATIEGARVLREASERDRAWWEEVTGSRAAIKVPLAQEMERSGITLEAFREVFDRTTYKSFNVVFHQLRAERIIHPDQPRPVRALSEADATAWLTDEAEHEAVLAAFLKSPFARHISGPFEVHAFDTEDVGAFLKDRKRRIAVDADARALRWWTQLERRRPPFDMLVLAECVLRMPAELAEVVNEISIGTPHGLTYAFAALLTRRAIETLSSRSISKTEGWSDVEILLRLQDVKLGLGWPTATEDARQFWERLEQDNAHRLGRVLQLAEELARRDGSIDRYHDAYLASNTDNIDANLAYVDYLSHRAAPWDGAAAWPTSEATERWAYETARPRYTDASALTAEQLAGRLKILLARLGWDEANDSLKAWWRSLEQRAAPEILLRLAEELDVRRSSLAQLRTACVDGDTANLLAALAYLDFTLLKTSETRQAQERAAEHNRLGNTLYTKERYREAIQSYEAAIKAHPVGVYYSNLAGAWQNLAATEGERATREALAALHRGLQRFPDSTDLREALELAETRQRLGALGALPRLAKTTEMLSVVTPIAMEFAANLLSIVEESTAGPRALLARVTTMRERVAADTGIRVPGLRVRSNDTDLDPGTYLFMVDEIPLVMGTVSLDEVLTMTPGAELDRLGIAHRSATNPVTGEAAAWISAADAPRVADATWDATEYILRHLEAVARKNLGRFFGMQEIVNRLEQIWTPVAQAIASDPTKLARFARMSQALLDEAVPMTDLDGICVKFAEDTARGTSMDALLAGVRGIPELTARLPGNQPGARVFELAPSLEKTLRQRLTPLGDEYVLALSPELTQKVLAAVRSTVRTEPGGPAQALVVRDPTLRRYVRRLVELEFPDLFTLSQEELSTGLVAAPRTTIALDSASSTTVALHSPSSTTVALHSPSSRKRSR